MKSLQVLSYSGALEQFQDKMDFGSDFGANLAPFSLPQSIIIGCCRPLGGILGPLGDILVRFLLGWCFVTDFYLIL